MKLKPHPNDKEPIHGYTVRYKPEFGDWDTVQVPATAQKYTIENLWCGSRYQISVTAYNGYVKLMPKVAEILHFTFRIEISFGHRFHNSNKQEAFFKNTIFPNTHLQEHGDRSFILKSATQQCDRL